MPNNLPSNLDPNNNRMMNGQLYTRKQSTNNADKFNYMGPNSGFNSLEEAQAADQDQSANEESWVPGDNSPGYSFGDIVKHFILPMATAGIPVGGGAVGTILNTANNARNFASGNAGSNTWKGSALNVASQLAPAVKGIGPTTLPGKMAVSGGTRALDTASQGGNWKQSLLQGGIGALTTGVGNRLEGSSSPLAKLASGALGDTRGKGALGNVGSYLGNMGQSALMNKLGDKNQSNYSQSSGGTSSSSGGTSSGGNAPGFQYGSNNPNLADSIKSGREMAVKNQQFRKGYDILGNLPEATTETPNPTRPVLSRMPKISSNVDRGNLYGRRR